MSYEPADHAPAMWDHQARVFEESAHLKEYALWHQQRTGKSRIIVDTSAFQYEAGVIDAVIVIAYPSAVHFNWAAIEFPAYLPTRIQHKILAWNSKRAGNREFQQDMQNLLNYHGLAIFTFNCEALTRTKALWPYLQKFCHKRRVLAVADECNFLANPNAAITKRAEALARRAVTRRILTGTPVEESPFDAFGMCNFLHRGILGFETAAAFRAYYGRYDILKRWDGEPITRYDPHQRKEVPIIQQVGYQNLEELQTKLLQIGSRVLRSDCADLPEKLYRKAFFDLEPGQRAAYDSLREEYRIELEEGKELTALNPLARLGLLSMIARGYLPERDVGSACPECHGAGCDTCDGMGLIRTREPRRLLTPDYNPAIARLCDEVLALDGAPLVVWCRYLWDVRDCLESLTGLGRKAVRYDGSVAIGDRVKVSNEFQNGTLDTIVATRAGSRGIKLDRAEALIYYSQGYSLIDRSQSEDRAESLLNRQRGTMVIDLIAHDTVDEHIVDTLKAKKSVAEMVMGDPIRNWI